MKYNERWASGVIIPPILPASILMDPSHVAEASVLLYLPPFFLSLSRFIHYEWSLMLFSSMALPKL